MLKGIPSILTPELLKVLMEMGHGDELVIADGNYPRFGHPERVIRCDGHGVPELLDAILKFMPLDPYVENPVILMEVLPNDPVVPVIWDTYKELIDKHGGDSSKVLPINKYTFYERAAKAYAVVTTSEAALYANIILKKGVVVE
ncbi:fucose isomerase [Sporanaerobium hydrogeniformans]|uniref:Fucose isomerase n=1 Tax=Sporanaerobium hydrogeniformans TaxID=3072179 RepID=A0AC61DFZ1_9FIRM|nr:RbsD/FucU domain-containing protein [Sporanaerobium hydrogeniformans]PHV72139.1 fucose isomerase [Sporanaerobium hydrogeniformans]